MALGKITVNALNLAQGEFPSIEKYFLFIGTGVAHLNELLFLNTDSDLDVELGSADSEIKRQIQAARANAGQNWACAAIPMPNGALWSEAVDMAMNSDVRVEAVVVCTPVESASNLTDMQEKAEEINAMYGRRLFFIACAAEIDGSPLTGQSWGTYIAQLTTLVSGISAYRVSIVPLIFPNAVGIYAGRLCSYKASVADTPMRTITGALVGSDITDFPVDKDGIAYSNAHAKALNDQRFSVPQTYADYPGVFWSDGQTLDAPAGDYQVIENLRVVDKAARAVRLVLIGLIGDRRLNSEVAGEAWAINKLMRPLYEMSRSYVFQGIPFPAELKSPKDGDIAINWITRTQVEIFMKARPFEIPKDLTANIVLDLSAPTA